MYVTAFDNTSEEPYLCLSYDPLKFALFQFNLPERKQDNPYTDRASDRNRKIDI